MLFDGLLRGVKFEKGAKTSVWLLLASALI